MSKKSMITIPTVYYTGTYDEFADLCADNRDRSRCYQRGESVQTLMDSTTMYHLVKKGSVALYITNQEGYRKLLLICGPGMIFPIFRDYRNYKTNHTIEFQVLEELEADVLYEKTMEHLLRESPAFVRRTLNCALDILDLYTYDAVNVAYNDCRSSVCNLLYLLYRQMPGASETGKLNISHEIIACATGHSRPRTSKELSYLCKQKIIDTRRASITVLDPERLVELCTYDVKEEL